MTTAPSSALINNLLKHDALAWESGVSRQITNLQAVAAVEFLAMLNGCDYERNIKYVERIGESRMGTVDMYTMREPPHYVLAVRRPHHETPADQVRTEIDTWRRLTTCDRDARYIVPLIAAYECVERAQFAMLTPIYGKNLIEYLIDFEAAARGSQPPRGRSAADVVQDEVNRLMAHIEVIYAWLHNVCHTYHMETFGSNFLMDLNTNTPRITDWSITLRSVPYRTWDEDIFSHISEEFERSGNESLRVAVLMSPAAIRNSDQVQVRINEERRVRQYGMALLPTTIFGGAQRVSEPSEFLTMLENNGSSSNNTK
jgi:hypothetical protein